MLEEEGIKHQKASKGVFKKQCISGNYKEKQNPVYQQKYKCIKKTKCFK